VQNLSAMQTKNYKQPQGCNTGPCTRPHIVLNYVYSMVCSACDITNYLITRLFIYLLD